MRLGLLREMSLAAIPYEQSLTTAPHLAKSAHSDAVLQMTYSCAHHYVDVKIASEFSRHALVTKRLMCPWGRIPTPFIRSASVSCALRIGLASDCGTKQNHWDEAKLRLQVVRSKPIKRPWLSFHMVKCRDGIFESILLREMDAV